MTARVKPFTGRADRWDSNRQTATVIPAILHADNWAQVPGVHIRQAGAWLVLTEDNAVQLANDILDTIETRHATLTEQATK